MLSSFEQDGITVKNERCESVLASTEKVMWTRCRLIWMKYWKLFVFNSLIVVGYLVLFGYVKVRVWISGHPSEASEESTVPLSDVSKSN